MGDKEITINKVGGPRKTTAKHATYPKSSLRTKTMRKITGVADPSRSPPFKSEGKVRILTAFGEKQKRKTTQRALRNLTDAQVREKLSRSRFAIGPHTPPELAKLILISGTEAGMIP